MKLIHQTWQDIRDLSTETLVVIPTGAIEQHGPHLPVVTDTLLVTSVVEAVDAEISERLLVTPTVWLGASLHHLPFPGSLSASFATYESALTDVMASLARHGFWRFCIVNGHGGNTSLNNVTLRKWKDAHPAHLVAAVDYYDLIPKGVLEEHVKGPAKGIHHACEIETSLMMHVAPKLVRFDRAVDDGLTGEGDVKGIVWNYDEVSEQGSYGYATLATPELGKVLFDAAVEGLKSRLTSLADPVILKGIETLDKE